MNQINIQNLAAGNGLTLRGLQALLGGQQMGGDGFAAIFMQLMMGLGENGAEGDLEALLAQMKDSQEEDATQNGMQMLAEMFFTNNPQTQVLLEQLQGQDVNAINGVQQGVQMAQQVQTQDAEVIDEADPDKTMITEVWSQVSTEAEGKVDGEQLLHGRSQFQNAILAAKQKLGSMDEKHELPVLDIDALQAKADSTRFDPMASVQRTEGMQAEARSVVNQLKTGILDNLAKKNNEFIVKLKPEGLGEITVKLIEKGDSISLSILTSSAHVAKLISNEVAALQNALRPLQAEVTQIATYAPQATEAAAEYAGFHEEGFRQQQQFAGQNSSRNSSRQGTQQEEPEDLTWGVDGIDDESLDVYI